MNIAILSRGPTLYSTQSLIRAGIQRGHQVRVIDHTRCHLFIEKGRPQIYYDNLRLSHIDAIIPRVGASVTAYGAAVIEHFEMMNVFSLMRPQALQQARDKLRSLQKLARSGIPAPKTALIGPTEDLLPMINVVGGLPIVIKLLESTHGEGVVMAETHQQALSIIEAFQRLKERVLIQEFIREANGADIRALVIGNEVVAVMKRQAAEGDFRSNLHRGASAGRDRLTEEETELVKRTVKVMGLEVAGVDLLRSDRGPLVIEVNASPGLEGIETITGVPVAAKIIQHLENRYQAWRELQKERRKTNQK
jgi:ribosomal protein S6--L-glutamate ligase